MGKVYGNIKEGVEIFGVAGTYETPTETKTVTPSASSQTITPSSGKHLSSVTVNGDTDLIAENIKEGVNIFGVEGTLNFSLNSDAFIDNIQTAHYQNGGGLISEPTEYKGFTLIIRDYGGTCEHCNGNPRGNIKVNDVVVTPTQIVDTGYLSIWCADFDKGVNLKAASNCSMHNKFITIYPKE